VFAKVISPAAPRRSRPPLQDRQSQREADRADAPSRGGVPSRKTLSKIIEPKSWHRIRLSNSAPDLKMTDVNIPSRIGQIPMTTGAYGNVAGEEMPLPTTGTASIDDRFDACQ
jgi:hypothetical protein